MRKEVRELYDKTIDLMSNVDVSMWCWMVMWAKVESFYQWLDEYLATDDEDNQ